MLVGVGLGVVLRIWMRLISDDPEFSWGGTIAIVTVFTLLGFMGIYAALSFLFVVLMGREIAHGPE